MLYPSETTTSVWVETEREHPWSTTGLVPSENAGLIINDAMVHDKVVDSGRLSVPTSLPTDRFGRLPVGCRFLKAYRLVGSVGYQ